MIEFIPADELAQEADIDRLVLPWVHAAGNPYYDWFFGGHELAASQLKIWLRSPSSEVSKKRARLLLVDGAVAGGYVAMGAAELVNCRRADLIALIKRSGGDRAQLQKKIEASRGIFPAPEAGDFYLSKIGVLEGHRGLGLGERLLEHFLSEGRKEGVSGFSLDVAKENAVAIHLYRKAGFSLRIESSIAGAGISYQAYRRAP
jgi:ribosomal protein S18 acetylase RimI-like enzyme